MKNQVFRQWKRKIQKFEEAHGNLEAFVLRSTNQGAWHKLRMDVSFPSKTYRQMLPVYDNLADLELADLMDFQNLVGLNGDELQTR